MHYLALLHVLKNSVSTRGVADGGGGRVAGSQYPALLKTAGDDPPEIWIFKYLFLETYFLHFPTFSK